MTSHIPILLEPIVQGLTESIQPGGPFADVPNLVWLDCTLGGGGHSGEILSALRKWGPQKNWKLISVDRDIDAIERARDRFREDIIQGRLVIEHGDFASVVEKLNTPFAGILADLGFSSDQIDSPDRGLSFLKEGPLDMRMDRSQKWSAWDIVNQWSESDLADLFFQFGEERHSRRIARLMVQVRALGEFKNSTTYFAELIRRGYPPGERHQGRIHPATRVFQALRIHVNDELGQLDRFLTVIPDRLAPGGRIAILSFHSLEDRRVKNRFKSLEHFRALTKKPLEADEKELAANPRSRSAKLRIYERLE
jgi:16S rRNA (cytosine1402-N4)-methyltransferase